MKKDDEEKSISMKEMAKFLSPWRKDAIILPLSDFVRAGYAKEIIRASKIWDHPRLEQAFCTVYREDFVGLPPWLTDETSKSPLRSFDDPTLLYQDESIVVEPVTGINDGSPSINAVGLNALQIGDGARVAHIGIGGGYYSAILSNLVGVKGEVVGVEADTQIFDRAKQNLKKYPNVQVLNKIGGPWFNKLFDAIYVSYAANRPDANWINCLKVGGTLVFPLGVPTTRIDSRPSNYTAHAALLKITRKEKRIAASFLCRGRFCFDPAGRGTTDEQELKILESSFLQGGVENISEMRWGTELRQNEWYSSINWGLVNKNW